MKRWMAFAAAVALFAVMIGAAQAGSVHARFKVGPNGTNTYSPTSDTVKKGQDAVWKNVGGVTHTVTFWKGPWKGKEWTLQSGDKVRKTMKKKGTYRFHCTRPGHSNIVTDPSGKKSCTGMCGKLKVRSG